MSMLAVSLQAKNKHINIMKEDKIKEEELLEEDELKEEEGEVYITFDIATYPSDFTLAGIYQMWKDKDIVIPDFQREFVWGINQSSLLIESFLLGLPVPPVFFYIDEDNSNLVIDGQQRILSTVFFYQGFFGHENSRGKKQVFRLGGLNKKSPYYKKTYDELKDSDKRKLNTTVLRAINIRQLSPTGESTSMYHIFERLNTGGTPLKSQEIRNVVFRGELVAQLRALNEDDNWRKILGIKKLNKHQRDVELVLRMLAFMKGPSSYEKPMKEFLNIAMKDNRFANTVESKKFNELFPKTTKFLIDTLGEKPFHLRGRLSTSSMDTIFPIVMNNFSKLSDNFKDKFDQLVENKEFIKLTTLATTDESIVKARHELVKNQLLGK